MDLSRRTTYLLLALVVAIAVAAGCARSKPVSIVAYYPLNPDHMFIADYLKSLEKKPEFKGKITVEIIDMQSSEGREKWKTTGLGCAGVFINGKTRWEGLRDGKQETVDFIKRMGSFWDAADLEAVLKQQITDPTKPAVLPSAPAKPKQEAKPEGEAKDGEKPEVLPKGGLKPGAKAEEADSKPADVKAQSGE